ncbi:MAG: hypothetical protein V4662_24985 [Verrucomicrobiota bacterium]
MTPETHWACACIKRDHHGRLKAIKLNPIKRKSCRVCGSHRDTVKPGVA